MSEPWEDFAPTETAVETAPWDDFKSTVTEAPIREDWLLQPETKVPDLQATTRGGPRVPVASMAETLAEPIEEFTKPRLELPKLEHKPSDPAILTVGKEAVNILSGIPEFASSNVGILGLLGAEVAPVATGAAFTTAMLKDLGNQILSTYKDWDKMTRQQQIAAVTDAVGTGILTGLVAKGTGKALRKSITKPGEPIAPVETPTDAVRKLALEEQQKAGWDRNWPFVPADLGNPSFREAIRNDPTLSSQEKAKIFQAGGKLLGTTFPEAKPPSIEPEKAAEVPPPALPSFAARYDPETLLQRPAWVKPGSAFDKALGDLRDKFDPFQDKDVTGIWKSLTPEQQQDLNSRGWVPTTSRKPGQILLHLANDAVAAKNYYRAQARKAYRESTAKLPPTEQGEAAVKPPPAVPTVSAAEAAPVVVPTEASAPAISEVKAEAKEVQAPIGPGAKTTGEQPYAAIKQLTDQLNAAPPVGEAQALPWRERVATTWAKGKSAFEGALAKAMAITPTIRDAARGVRDVTDLDRRVGTLDYLLQRSAGQSRENGKAIMRQMPNKAMREAVAIWIDSGGDEVAIRNTLATLKPSIKPNVRRALEQAANLPPEARQFAEQLKQFFGIREQDAIASDVFQQGLEDYYTHIWEREQNMPEGLRVALSNGKVNDYFQFARQRKISTFLQGIQYGMNPKLDPAKVVPYYNYALDRAIASREFIKRLTEMDAPDGRPAVLPNGTAVPVEKGDTPGALIINPRGKTELGKDYLLVNHPSMRKWKWMGTDEKGNPILYRGDLAVNPLLHERLARMLDRTRLTSTKWGAAALRASAEVKGFKLGFLSAFHQVHVGSHALWHWTLPFRTEAIDWDAPNVRFAIEKGHLKIAADPSNLSQFSEDIMGQGLVHKLPMVGPWAKAYSEWLFGDYIPQLKVKTFQNAYDRNLKAYAKDIQRGKITEEQIASRVGDSINNAYGELNHWFLGKYGRDPRLQRILRAVFLAPDFGEARLRFTEKAFTKYGFEERLAFVTMFLTMYTAARVGNWLSHGDPEWEAKRMFQVKEGNKWYSMRSVAGDLVHALTNFGQFMYVRLNPLYSRTVSDVLFQRDVYGRKLSLGDMFKRLGEQVIPIQFGNLTRDDQTIWDSFITSMGLQSRHDMPQFEVSKVVREYMAKSSDPKLKAMAERMEQELFAPSDYRPLRQALKDGNLKKASEEYDKLIKEKGKKPSVISSALRPYAKTEGGYTVTKPIGPLSVSEWQKFKRTLTKPQLKELQQAEKERLNVYQNFIELMKTK